MFSMHLMYKIKARFLYLVIHSTDLFGLWHSVLKIYVTKRVLFSFQSASSCNQDIQLAGSLKIYML